MAGGPKARPLLVDWGAPALEDRSQGHRPSVAGLLLHLLDALGEPPLLAGFIATSGTLATAAAILTTPVRESLTIAAVALPALWRSRARNHCSTVRITDRPARQLGLVPMEFLQAGFLANFRSGAHDRQVRALRPVYAAGSDQATPFVALGD